MTAGSGFMLVRETRGTKIIPSDIEIDQTIYEKAGIVNGGHAIDAAERQSAGGKVIVHVVRRSDGYLLGTAEDGQFRER